MRFLQKRPWLLPLLFYAGIGLCLSQSHGAYHPQMIVLFCALGLTFAALAPVSPSTNIDPRPITWIGPILVVLFAAGQCVHPLLFYAERASRFYAPLKLTLVLTASAAAFWAGLTTRSSSRKIGQAFWICVVLFALSRVLVLLVSPDPFIDVFVKIRLAVQHLLHGENPYGSIYPDIYKGRYGYFPGFPYLPGLLIWVTPFQAVTGDPRSALLAADLLTAAVIYRLTWRRTASASLSQIVCLLWLAFPVNLFILEQSWIDNLLILEIAGLTLCLCESKWMASGMCLGLLLVTKQYTIFAVFFSLVWIGVRVRKKEIASSSVTKIIFGCAAVSLLALAPFVAWGPKPFLYDTIYSFRGITFRPDSFSVPALFANLWAVKLPNYLPIVLYSITLLGLLVQLLRQPNEVVWSRALIIMYSVTFLFGVQAFCNYYQLVAFLVLLNFVLILGGIKLSPPHSEPR